MIYRPKCLTLELHNQNSYHRVRENGLDTGISTGISVYIPIYRYIGSVRHR